MYKTDCFLVVNTYKKGNMKGALLATVTQWQSTGGHNYIAVLGLIPSMASFVFSHFTRLIICSYLWFDYHFNYPYIVIMILKLGWMCVCVCRGTR